MLFLIFQVSSILIQDRKSGKFISRKNKNLSLGTILTAIDFDLETTTNPAEFIAKVKDTDQVISDPGRLKQGKVYFGQKHGKPNQRISFQLTSNGAFNIVIKNKKLVYNYVDDSFVMSPDFENDDGEFVLIDKGVPYSTIFKDYPIKASMNLFEGEQRNPSLQPNNHFSYMDNRYEDDLNYDMRNNMYPDSFVPQPHHEFLKDYMHYDIHNDHY